MTKFAEIFKIFGAPFDPQEMRFEHNGQAYKLHLQEVFEDLAHLISANEDMEASAFAANGENVPLRMKPSGSAYVSNQQYQTVDAFPNFAAENPRLHAGTSTTYKKEFNPMAGSQKSLAPPGVSALNLSYMQRLEMQNNGQPDAQGNGVRHLRSHRSAISGLSGGMNAKSPREKSPIVSTHEQKAMRMRSRSKKKHLHSTQQSWTNLGGLQIERKNITEYHKMQQQKPLVAQAPRQHTNSQQKLSGMQSLKPEVLSKSQIKFAADQAEAMNLSNSAL